MRLPRFEYLEPKTIQEACSMLLQYKDRATVIAGGTDVLPKMKEREIAPQYLIGLKGIPHLNYVDHDEVEGLRIGALATLDALETSPLILRKFSILHQAIQQMASPRIRSLATIAGNLCSALPSADTAPPLIVMGAKLKLASSKRERIIPLEDFLLGPGETVLSEGELLAEIQVPTPPPHAGGVYLKHTLRAAMDLAIISVAALITLQNDLCSEVKICLGVAGPRPIRATGAEGILRGKLFTAELVEQAARIASEECSPRSSMRASAKYRREMVKVLTRRSLNQAWERATQA